MDDAGGSGRFGAAADASGADLLHAGGEVPDQAEHRERRASKSGLHLGAFRAPFVAFHSDAISVP